MHFHSALFHRLQFAVLYLTIYAASAYRYFMSAYIHSPSGTENSIEQAH